MKALLLTNEYPPYIYGGAGVHVEYLSRELEKIIKVEVRCFGDQLSEKNNLIVRGFGIDSNLYLSTDKLIRPALEALERCHKFNALNIDADVVHCHTWYTHYGGILAKIMYGIPLVITIHSLEPKRPWKREQLGRGYDFSLWVEKTAIEMADKIIAVSKETKQDVLQYFNVKPEKIAVITNGLDTEEYKPVNSKEILKKYNISDKNPFIMFVGRVTRQKGIIHLLNAVKYIDKNVQIVLCAGAPDTKEIGIEMEKGVTEANKGRNNVFWFRDMLPRKEIIELYSNSSVFVCPSIYEPFGIINLEAMACGIPVVGSAVGGIKEVVIDGKTGFLVPVDQQPEPSFEPKDKEKFARDLAEKVNFLIKNDDVKKKMGEEGRKRVIENYSWTKIAHDIVEEYKKIIK